MAKYVLLAMTNPVEGRTDEYNAWYDNTAYPTYKSIPGLTPLGRFKAVELEPMFPFQMENRFNYLSMYYFETDDVVAFMQSVKDAFGRHPEYSLSEDIDKSVFFEPVYVAMSDVNFAPIDRYEELKC
ncbi:hypothetical protein [Novosphingobium sp. 9U]|uniref:hypothetical protein n=1 Tax=Novosphingobium sp. 9U TaxID=2653158 RepID=UPI0012F10203|nr:hypothetical protein [Novosphingobium sp. 9U]VWX50039.1 conserved hypothetical protein [Novosphingobium sp. 9U]